METPSEELLLSCVRQLLVGNRTTGKLMAMDAIREHVSEIFCHDFNASSSARRQVQAAANVVLQEMAAQLGGGGSSTTNQQKWNI